MNVYKMVVLKRFLIYDESFFLARSSESIKTHGYHQFDRLFQNLFCLSKCNLCYFTEDIQKNIAHVSNQLKRYTLIDRTGFYKSLQVGTGTKRLQSLHRDKCTSHTSHHPHHQRQCHHQLPSAQITIPIEIIRYFIRTSLQNNVY